MKIQTTPTQLASAQTLRARVEGKLNEVKAYDNQSADLDASVGSVSLPSQARVSLNKEGSYFQDVTDATVKFDPANGDLKDGSVSISSYYQSSYGPSRASETVFSKTTGPVKDGWFSQPRELTTYSVESGSAYDRARFDSEGNLVSAQKGDTESGYLYGVKSVLTSPAGLGLVAVSAGLCGAPGTLGWAIASACGAGSAAPLVGGAVGATIATLGLAYAMKN